jgi:hypothetical protein
VQEPHARAEEKYLFYLVDWIPPDFGAVGQYGLLFSRDMARAGRNVKLIGLSTEAGGVESERFASGHLEIARLHAAPFDKSSFSKRLLWTAKSDLRLIWLVIRDRRSRRAELLFTGSPPFMLFFSFLAKGFRRTRLIYRITDFYPEVLFAAWGRKRPVFQLLENMTWFLRRRVDEFQVLGEDQRRLLIAGGVRPERITLKRDVAPIEISGAEAPATPPLALEGCRILLYSGNFGVAHETATVIEGLVLHQNSQAVRFGLWLNASGSAVAEVTEALESEGIPCAVSAPSPLEALPSVLAAADVHLVTLKAAFSGYVLPSKIYGCLKSRRPILYVGPKSSDVHLLCSQQTAVPYEQVDIGDVVGFALALARLSKFARRMTAA